MRGHYRSYFLYFILNGGPQDNFIGMFVYAKGGLRSFNGYILRLDLIRRVIGLYARQYYNFSGIVIGFTTLALYKGYTTRVFLGRYGYS